jgi:Asp-tRNA(Asn)/Glu-tRNA(Gln) amidotransferase A subunit family amidase
MVSDDACDPLATTIAGRAIRRGADFAVPAAVDVAGLRVALTPDFGFAPTERHIAEVFAEKAGLVRHMFAATEDMSPDCSGTDEVFETLRATAALTSHHDRVRDTPDAVGPNVHADVAAGLRLSALDVARASQHQTVLYRRWQLFFDRFDVILSPAVTISPRPWSELFPSSIDGKPTRTYYNWLALAYAVTVVGHPAVSLPVGLDRNGMPFGLQIVGRRGGDAQVLAVAAALERLLADDLRTARPVPNIAALAATSPLRDTPGFLGFG